jgi:hypothetical protein
VLGIVAVRLLNTKWLARTRPDEPVDAKVFGPELLALLTQISWLRGMRERKSLVCRPTLQKVSTTFSALSLVLL